jgi:hypothetical protein
MPHNGRRTEPQLDPDSLTYEIVRTGNPGPEFGIRGVVLNVFNFLQWCFNRLILAQSRHSGINVSPRIAVQIEIMTSVFERRQRFQHLAGSGPTECWIVLANFSIPEDQHTLSKLSDVVLVSNQHDR